MANKTKTKVSQNAETNAPTVDSPVEEVKVPVVDKQKRYNQMAHSASCISVDLVSFMLNSLDVMTKSELTSIVPKEFTPDTKKRFDKRVTSYFLSYDKSNFKAGYISNVGYAEKVYSLPKLIEKFEDSKIVLLREFGAIDEKNKIVDRDQYDKISSRVSIGLDVARMKAMLDEKAIEVYTQSKERSLKKENDITMEITINDEYVTPTGEYHVPLTIDMIRESYEKMLEIKYDDFMKVA